MNTSVAKAAELGPTATGALPDIWAWLMSEHWNYGNSTQVLRELSTPVRGWDERRRRIIGTTAKWMPFVFLRMLAAAASVWKGNQYMFVGCKHQGLVPSTYRKQIVPRPQNKQRSRWAQLPDSRRWERLNNKITPSVCLRTCTLFAVFLRFISPKGFRKSCCHNRGANERQCSSRRNKCGKKGNQ